MIKVSQQLATLQPSQTIRLDTQAKAMLAAGKSVINLSVGELDFEPPASILQAAHAAIDASNNHYTSPQGMVETRQAVTEYLHTAHQLNYSPEDILITNGAKQAIFAAIQALVNAGDEILVPTPCWVSYVEQIKLAGGTTVAVPTTNTFQLDLENIRAAITKKTVGIIINYPNNPTGAVYPETDLHALAELCAEYDLWVLSDEIYERLLFDQNRFKSFAHFAPDRTILINGVSKSGALTGWRMGYAAGPRLVIAAMTALQSHTTGNVANVVQHTAQQALADSQTSTDYFLQELTKRRHYIAEWLAQQPQLGSIPPAGAFYYFIDIHKLTMDSIAFCDRLLNECGVALVPGKYFGCDGYVRLSFANSLSNIKTACERISACVASYS